MSDIKDFTVYINNYDSSKVSEDILYELFHQAGPIQHIKYKNDFTFIDFEDEESVVYSCNLLNDVLLFDIPLKVKPRKGSKWENADFMKFPTQAEYLDRQKELNRLNSRNLSFNVNNNYYNTENEARNNGSFYYDNYNRHYEDQSYHTGYSNRNFDNSRERPYPNQDNSMRYTGMNSSNLWNEFIVQSRDTNSRRYNNNQVWQDTRYNNYNSDKSYSWQHRY